jgi:hypothetical protein
LWDCSSLNTNRYALLLNPIARSLEELRPEGFLSETSFAILLRAGLVALNVVIAFLIPFFGKKCTSFLNYVFMSSAYLSVLL